MGFSTITAAGLVVMESWVLRRTHSTAIAADRTHYATDIAVNLAVLAALAITLLTAWQRADPVFAPTCCGMRAALRSKHCAC
jgi:ferrous-iron efflux pump FieF